MPRRTYLIRKRYAVFCSDCHEDVSDGSTSTEAEAEKARDVHEAWHRGDEKRADRELKGP